MSENITTTSNVASTTVISDASVTIDLTGRQEWSSTPKQVAHVANGVKFMSKQEASTFIAILKGLQAKSKEDAAYSKAHPKPQE